MEFIRPCSTKTISDNYAAHIRRGSGLPGTDFTCRVGEAVVAVADGVVTRANNFGASGNNVRIHHKNGFTSYSLHLSKIRVKNGDVVKQGQLIGLSGGKKGAPGSGSSTGPHLHFSLANASGKLVDPEDHLGKESPKPIVIRKTVRLGSVGADVKYLQRRLGVLADGIFGLRTRSAVIKFQKSHRIVADGIVGPKTWAVIG